MQYCIDGLFSRERPGWFRTDRSAQIRRGCSFDDLFSRERPGLAQSREKPGWRRTARSAQIRLSVQGLCAKKRAQSSFNFFWLRELHHLTPQGRGAGSAFEVGRELRAKFTDAGPLP